MSTPEITIAAIGLFIALMSLIVAGIVVITSRIHNRLSFQPLVMCGLESDERGVSLVLTNAGTGPATITRFELRHLERDGYFKSLDELREFTTEIQKEIPKGLLFQKLIASGFVLGGGKEVIIVGIKTDKQQVSKELYDPWFNLVAGYSVRGEYESNYKKKTSFSYGRGNPEQ